MDAPGAIKTTSAVQKGAEAKRAIEGETGITVAMNRATRLDEMMRVTLEIAGQSQALNRFAPLRNGKRSKLFEASLKRGGREGERR